MAYMSKDISILAYTNGFTLWHYTTSDTAMPAGYFNAAADMLRSGDIIIANLGNSGTPRAALILIANASNGIVTFSDMTNTAHLPRQRPVTRPENRVGVEAVEASPRSGGPGNRPEWLP